jgi:hypothetical protein
VSRTRYLTPLLAAGLVVLPACGTPQAAGAQDWQTLNSSRREAGEQLLRVDVEYGAGTLSLAAGPDDLLYRSNVRYDAASFKPLVEYQAGRLKLGLTGSTVRGRNIRGGELDLQLSPRVPVELDLQFGAAEAALDLGGLQLRSLNLQTGASRTALSVSQPNRAVCSSARIAVGAAKFEATGLGNLNAPRLHVQGGVGEVVLDFSGAWASDMSAHVEMGLGSLTLRVPRGLGVSVARSGVLTSFDGQGLVKRGNSYYSENWDGATRRLSLNIDAALGSIRVVWLES